MNRKSFLKSIGALVLAPSVLSKLAEDKKRDPVGIEYNGIFYDEDENTVLTYNGVEWEIDNALQYQAKCWAEQFARNKEAYIIEQLSRRL